MKIKLNSKNYSSILYLAEIAKQGRLENLEIEINNKADNLPAFFNIMKFVYSVLNYEIFFNILLRNFPYCVVGESSRDHIYFEKKYKGEKSQNCKKCKYNDFCGGFPLGYFKKFGKTEVCQTKDIPFEVMLEVESKCNFNCGFCFNKTSFAKNDRNLEDLSNNYFRKIIKNISSKGIKNIRFTGGEPLLREDVLDLMKYSKDNGLYVILNTNTSLINPTLVRKIKKIVDNILIPIEGWNNEEEFKVTSFNGSLSKKISAINLLKKEDVSVIRVGTVATKKIIQNFRKMESLIMNLPIDEWEFYRPITVSGKEELNSGLIKKLIDNLIRLRKKDKMVYIANSLPFCSINNPYKVNMVSRGALFDEGHSRIVIDPRGFAKPHYFIDYNLGSPLNIISAWNHSFMKKVRNLEFLPKECKGCLFINKCCGGSRYVSKLINGSYYKPDPLANYNNKIVN